MTRLGALAITVCSLCVPTGAATQEPAAPGPVAWWSFDALADGVAEPEGPGDEVVEESRPQVAFLRPGRPRLAREIL